MPANVRRTLPPHLTEGRATVDLDEAVAQARQRVERAREPAEQIEALVALGSTLAGAGELGGAADALERAVALGAGAPARAWLAVVCWWAGDLVGTEAALTGAGDVPRASWARAQLALAAGRPDVARTHAAGDDAVLAHAALAEGDLDSASRLARAAYATALGEGGFALSYAGAVAAWTALRAGDRTQALAAADVLERRVGRYDVHTRLHVALIRAAAATDPDEHERAERRVRDIRRRGFALVEAMVRSLLDSATPPTPSMWVRFLGDAEVRVGGQMAEWRSHKAREVVRYLAAAGSRGAARETIIEAVWPDRPSSRGRALLRTALGDIRRTLEPTRLPGEPSAFLDAGSDQVVLRAETDLADATALLLASDAEGAFELLRPGWATLRDEGDWAEEQRRSVERLRLEAADRVAGDERSPLRIAALEALAVGEPWRKDVFDALAATHRARGDEAAARAVERRWFQEDG
jgi:DNA-binding SARP family transcriptional activator